MDIPVSSFVLDLASLSRPCCLPSGGRGQVP